MTTTDSTTTAKKPVRTSSKKPPIKAMPAIVAIPADGPHVVEATVPGDAATREDRVRRAAYHLYLDRGGAPGDPLDDWLRAEAQVDRATTAVD